MESGARRAVERREKSPLKNRRRFRFAPFIPLALVLAACQATRQSPLAYWSGSARPAGAGVDGAQPVTLGADGTDQPNATDGARPVNYAGTGRFIADGSMRGGQNPQAGSGGVRLNFVKMPVAQAAKVVLGDILSLDYVIDPKVSGAVTIQTSHPVTRAAALDLFQSALRAANAALIANDGLYAVVPISQAAAAGTNLAVGENASPAFVGSGIRVVQLRYVSAANMEKVVDPLAPKGAIVKADKARNVLILSGTPAEIASMLAAIRVFDVDSMRGMSFGVAPVKTSDPKALADSLRRLFQSRGSGPMAGMLRFIPNRSLGSILVISPQAKYIADAETWIRRLDARAAGDEREYFTYNVQNRSAKQLVQILRSVLAGGKGAKAAARSTIAPREASDRIGAKTPTSSTAANFGQLTHANFGLGAADSAGSKGEDGAQSAAGKGVAISSDDSDNKLIIRATPRQYRSLVRLIKSLDVMPNQVLIQATVAEVTLNNELKFGVRWFFQKQASSATFSDDAAGALSSVFPGFSYALRAGSAQATLNALSQVTHVEVLSSPSLMVLDNRTATLQVGDQVPISTQSSVSTLAAGAPVISSVSYRNTGVILSITPRINESGRVLLDIQQEVSSVSPTTSSNIDSPTIQQRKIKTTVVLSDGQSLTLGGLMQRKKNVAKDQIPVLGDIPLLGNAFRSKDDTVSRTELLIIITPHVVRNLDEAREATSEYRREITDFSPRSSPGRKIRETVRRLVE